MASEGFLELELREVGGVPATDLKTRVSIFRAADNRELARQNDLQFPPNQTFRLPAFPQERNMFADITPSRYRQCKSDFFTLSDGETIKSAIKVFRRPDKWKAQFNLWADLPPTFQDLKDILDDSPQVKLLGGSFFDSFTGDTYDSVTDTKAVLAKAALLNLHAVLTDIKEPTTNARPWFSFVRRIVAIGRERFLAIVDPEMAGIIRQIKDNLGQFTDYRNTPAQNHFDDLQKNAPAGFKILKTKMFSIKNREDHGNIQLTIGPSKNPDGGDTMFLDADIDEDGRLFEHIADVFKHKFTGGTHPFDIHEFIVLANSKADLGYQLI